METLVQTLLLQKRLSKYTSEQLIKKLNNSETKAEEIDIIKEILIKRKALPLVEVAVENSISPVVKKENNDAFKKAVIEEATKIVEKVKSSDRPISELIDDIYELNDKVLNKKLCDIFPEDGVDDYDELPQEIKDKVKEFHLSIFNPKEQIAIKEKELKAAKEVKKEKRAKVDAPKSTLAKNKARSLKMTESGIILVDGENTINRPVVDDLKLDCEICFGDNIVVKKKKDNLVVEGVVKSIFNGIYEKDFVIIVKDKDNKEKWIKLSTTFSIIKG